MRMKMNSSFCVLFFCCESVKVTDCSSSCRLHRPHHQHQRHSFFPLTQSGGVTSTSTSSSTLIWTFS